MHWFRLYADIIHDSKLRLLAFEDRWHFIALCALKCDGLLDKPESDLRLRQIAVAMGVQLRELDEIKRRLVEVELIDESFQPIRWDKRQYKKAGSLPDGESLDGYNGYIYFIADDRLETVKIGYSRNPWARVKDLQIGRGDRLSVVATVKTTEASEVDIHHILADERQNGEWFEVSGRIKTLIQAIKAKRIKDCRGVVDYVANYVAATKDTDTETELESSSEDSSSGDEPALAVEEVFCSVQTLLRDLGLPVPRDLTPERRQLLRFRIAQYPLEDFQTVFAKCRDSPFLRGDKGRTPLKFDWLFKKANFQKVLEGNYD